MQIVLECLDERQRQEFIVETPEISVAHPDFLIGRSSDCDLQIDNQYVSRRHCELLLDHRGGKVRVRDLGSQNGTFVNEQPVVEEKELQDGDRLAVAAIPFEVHIR